MGLQTICWVSIHVLLHQEDITVDLVLLICSFVYFSFLLAMDSKFLFISAYRLVIMSLVDLAQGKHRHVPYRDSRLTFLLQVREI